MSVDTALALRAHRMEYVLAIEGIGWTTDDADPFSAFLGDVWATQDFNGDLATQLGSASVHYGLRLGSAIEDSIDPITAEFKSGQMTFEIVSADDWWNTNFWPHRTNGDTTTLSQDLEYSETTVYLTDGTDFDAGDTVWLGGRELVKLGTKALVGGTEYSYTNSTRAYLGTTRGRRNSVVAGAGTFQWSSGTNVYSWYRFFAHRRIRFYAHVPGETRANMALLWVGKITDINLSNVGHLVRIAGGGDYVAHTRTIVRKKPLVCHSNTFGEHTLPRGTATTRRTTLPEIGAVRKLYFGIDTRRSAIIDDPKYDLAMAYRYRTEPGGTAGMRSTWDSGSVQALNSSNGNDLAVIARFLKINDKTLRVIKRDQYSGSEQSVVAEVYSSVGTTEPIEINPENGEPLIEIFPLMSPCHFLMDNWADDPELNHYAVNNKVVRHPINVALSHMTTCDDEYFIGDAAAGSTTSAIVFTAPGFTADEWIGAALHCVEGNNKGQSRVITDNTTTTITVDEAFDGGAVAVGDEFQIRNSIYDTLPYGWGMGIPWTRLDIDSFEEIRDKYMPDATTGKFILGTDDTTDIWDLIKDEIFKPYGIGLYFNRSTGKLAAQYIGQAGGDGILTDYVTVNDQDIIDISDVNAEIANPIGSMPLTVRAFEERIVGYRTTSTFGKRYRLPHGDYTVDMPLLEAQRQFVAAGLEGQETVIPHRHLEFDAFSDSNKDEMPMSAKFNCIGNQEFVTQRIHDIMRRWAVPPPGCDITLAPSFMTTVRPGTFLAITKTDGVVNPFTGSRGWTDVVAFVQSVRLEIARGPHVRCRVLLFGELEGGRVAPAAKLDGALSGSDGTSHYFVVAPTEFVSDAANDKDYYGFVVGDRIVLHNQDGSEHAATVYTIRSFGANDAAEPEDASTDIIRINEAAPLPGGIDADHYLTFDGWDGNTITRMKQYAAYASSAGTYTGGDAAKEWL